MATVQDICARALRRIRILGAGENMDAGDGALARDLLNSMLLRWPSRGLPANHSALALSDTFFFFVPPAAAGSDVIDALSYRGTWDANANSPALASSTGTKGYFYKVTTAGSTTLDSVTSWAVNDHAVFDGTVWLKSIASERFEQVVIDLLAMELCAEFGRDPSSILVKAASDGWAEVQSAFIKSPTKDNVDMAIRDVMIRRYAIDEAISS